MRKTVLRLGEKIMYPDINQQLVPYIVVGHEKGCVYHLVSESHFVHPRKRTIIKAKYYKKASKPVAA